LFIDNRLVPGKKQAVLEKAVGDRVRQAHLVQCLAFRRESSPAGN